MFISRGALLDIWSESRLEEFAVIFAPGFDKNSITEVRQRYVQTLSILVWIGWEDWSNFGTIFLQQNRADCDIPTYDLPDLQDPSFLGEDWAIRFYYDKYVFCPIDILEGQNIERNEGWRLPFLDGGREIGGGGFGVVDQEIIARGHFRFLLDHADERPLNHEKDLVVARKRFTIRSHFKTEMTNLSLLRANLLKHNHIVSCLATVTIGRDFNILFPLANMDLDQFLEGRYRELSSDFTLRDLMSEMWKLAEALSFLHGGLQPPRRKCRHRDLKPSNILLFFRGGFPVGQWKISDFGISVIDEADQGPTTTISDFVNNNTYPVVHEPQRYPNSTYQPPEASPEVSTKFGRRSDVWSFGCILMRVLAFGLGGEEELRNLDEQRALNDGSPGNTNDRSPLSGPPSHNGITATVASLVKAIKDKDIDDITTLLRGKVMVEENYDGDRPVIYAIRNLPQAVQMLQGYHRGLDLESPDSKGNTPLKLAVETRNARLVTILLDAGVNINAPSEDDLTPLMAAAKDGNGPMIYTLLCRGADYMAYSSCGYTCLHYAAINSTAGEEVFSPFKQMGVTVDIPTKDCGRTPLLLLISQYTDTPRWWKKFDMLLEAGADFNRADENKATPLSEAVRKHAVKLAERLLECKATYGEKPLPKVPPFGMNKIFKSIQPQNDRKNVKSFKSMVLLPFRRRRGAD
ncbi:hypothetical protein N8T08_005293 [Aspergillus melleus]|uniref:Uncharacterized protein n=1 Tax=Aspergillus melleus TaxID=138277 RepID=A0ACC3BFW9_9EURO|nr:hypothetical protein N8T08_005293 [Aspergillus melleus]